MKNNLAQNVKEHEKKSSPVISVEEAIEEIRQRRMIIVVDSEERENEGDLVMAADDITSDDINFMVIHARGLICTPVTQEIADRLSLFPMVQENEDVHRTAFTVSVDASDSRLTTGISATDRCLTIQKLAQDDSLATDFRRPGHIFPLIAKQGGVLVRAGHTEASIDLLSLAGKKPVAAICEIMNEDGSMARMPNLLEFANTHNIKICTIKDIIEYRRKKETTVQKVAEATLPTEQGTFQVSVWTSNYDNKEHIALTMGDFSDGEPVLVRVHSECLTGDVFHSLRCDCGPQLDEAMSMVQKIGRGMILYMRQEGRGIGIVNKIKAYHFQDHGLDTVEANEKLGFKADMREYGVGAQILSACGVRKIRLITNNPRKMVALEGHGLSIVERVPIIIERNPHNENYLETKKIKLGHLF